MFPVLPTSLFMLLLPHLCTSQRPEILSHAKRTQDGFHLPIYQRKVAHLDRRAGASGSIGLGDFQDITYNVLIKVGETETPLVLDTGSSDLWVISDACRDSSCSSGGITLYPQASFQSAGIDANLFYGDSQTGTHAFGEIGKDIAGVAGLSIQDQYFAAINDTNTTVSQTGSAGIFGLGFPVNSVIWSQLFRQQFPADSIPPSKRSNLRMTKFPDLGSLLGGSATGRNTARDLPYIPDFRRTRFPDLASLLPSQSNVKRQTKSQPSFTDLLNSFATNGPLLSRLAARGALSSPQFTITLQRDAIQVGGNVGMLSVGELPPGVSNDSLTWVPLRGYTPKEGGLDSPTDIYPIAWEVPIDGVFLDGQKLPPTTLSPGVTISALIDSGNSLIRGPQDVIQALTNTVTGSRTSTVFGCATPHTMAFQIGGKLFPIDPRDFIQPVQRGNMRDCMANVVATDPPRDGFLYSWSLGDPFMKSNLVSFYFGNLTHPSVDPPRMGFLSTVQNDAAAQLATAVSAAEALGNFPAKTEAAPTSNPSMATTISGVPQAATPGAAVTGTARGAKSNADANIGVARTLVAAVSFIACLLTW